MATNAAPVSPAVQRSASTGPNGPLPAPTTNAVVNGVGPAAGATTVGTAPSNAPALTQQNLNQIVSFHVVS